MKESTVSVPKPKRSVYSKAERAVRSKRLTEIQANRTPKQRSAFGRRAVRSRWKNKSEEERLAVGRQLAEARAAAREKRGKKHGTPKHAVNVR